MSLRDAYETGFDENGGKTINAETCPECAGDLLTEGGEISCTECGLIADEYRIDHGATPFSSDTGGTSERTGAPLTPARHDRGLSAEIGYGPDANGNGISGAKRRRLHRLRREHNRARWGSKAERNLGHGFSDIARMTSALDLPRSVRNRACTLFREAQRENLLQGRSIEAIAAASVFAACRSGGYVRTIDEVIEVATCERSGLLNAYRVLNVELGVKTKPIGPTDFVPRIATECNVPDRLYRRAQELASFAEESGLANGRRPSGVAAASLYLAAREHDWPLTQADLAEVANVSEATLRARYQELREELQKTESQSA